MSKLVLVAVGGNALIRRDRRGPPRNSSPTPWRPPARWCSSSRPDTGSSSRMATGRRSGRCSSARSAPRRTPTGCRTIAASPRHRGRSATCCSMPCGRCSRKRDSARPVVSLVTQVRVNDERSGIYPSHEADRSVLSKRGGRPLPGSRLDIWSKIPARGFRRVVPSPSPAGDRRTGGDPRMRRPRPRGDRRRGGRGSGVQ